MAKVTLDTTKSRGPSDLRNVLEVRVRKMATSYSLQERLQALYEMSFLIETAIHDLEAERAGLVPPLEEVEDGDA